MTKSSCWSVLVVGAVQRPQTMLNHQCLLCTGWLLHAHTEMQIHNSIAELLRLMDLMLLVYRVFHIGTDH